MTTSRRRFVAALAIVVLSLMVGGIVAIAAAAGDTERISGYWVGGVLADDGLLVTEVIDYDFGVSPRHGIFRTIPDALLPSIDVTSPTAPDQFVVTDIGYGGEVRIGDPDRTVTGRHRYRIDYTLPFESIVRDGLFSWDAIGTEWEVPIEHAHVAVAMAADLDAPTCRRGQPWSETACGLLSFGPGQFSAAVDGLAAGDGVTVSGALVPGSPPGAFPKPPDGFPHDPGSGVLSPFIAATVVAMLAGFAAALAVRRAGRERVWSGGAADAAFGEATDGLASRRVDERELAELATIEFEPPRDTSAVEGGLVLHESVRDQHLSAWLLESAIRGEIDITGEDDPELIRGDAPAHPSVHQILDGMFGSRSRITLDGYDATFATGWNRLESDLRDWLVGSAHWDSRGRKMRTRVIAAGILGGLVALAGLVVATVSAARHGGAAVYLSILAAAAVGAAIGAVVSAPELLVRTEAGSALWLRVESFRRFLEQSEARHVTEAAARGVLRQYTAWAVALGESKAWTAAVEAAAAGNPELRSTLGRDLAFASAGAHIASAAASASTAPSSSGGGGGFSGGVGGGGGGGGGGSW